MTPELSPSDICGRELPAGAVVLEEEGGVAGRSGPSELDEYLALRRRFEPDEGGRDVP